MIDNFITGTIPNTACFKISIITNVADDKSLRLTIKSCLSLNLVEESLFQHQNKIETYSVSVRSIMQDAENTSNIIERDFVFDVWEKTGQVTCFFDLGFQDDLLEFQSDKVKVQYEVQVGPVAAFH